MNNGRLAMSLVMLAAAMFASSAQAQGRIAFAPARPIGPVALRCGGGRIGFVHPHHPRRFFAGSAFAPYFYSDDDSEPGVIEAPPPQVTVLQSAQPPAVTPAPKPSESLLLELHGDHWVRITNYGQSQTAAPAMQPGFEPDSTVSPAVPPATARRAQAAEPPSPLPPAVLVFRDGRQQEIGKYTIVGATIYTSADYWGSGSWTRQVQIAELDVPATLKLNRERGTKFSLPSGPNQVIIRP
jgi:hypothetical protein